MRVDEGTTIVKNGMLASIKHHVEIKQCDGMNKTVHKINLHDCPVEQTTRICSFVSLVRQNESETCIIGKAPTFCRETASDQLDPILLKIFSKQIAIIQLSSRHFYYFLSVEILFK